MTRTSPITTKEIMRVVPHRHPFLMIDRVVELEPNKRVRGYKHVSSGDALVLDPIIGCWVLPRLMVIEAVGQAALVLVTYGRQNRGSSIPLFVGCEYEFHSDVEAGCRLDVEVEIEKLVSVGAILVGRAWVGSQTVADMRLTATFQRLGNDSANTTAEQS